MSSDITNTGTKFYDIRQVDRHGTVVAEDHVEAASSEAAAKQLRDVHVDTDKIEVCLDGQAMSEMAIDYWAKRVRRR